MSGSSQDPEVTRETTNTSRGWRRRSYKVPNKRETLPTPLPSETFETHVLRGADLPINTLQTNSLANSTILACDTNPDTVQYADGTQVSVSIAGNGHRQIVQGPVAPTWTITGTDASSAIAITTAGGNSRILFAGYCSRPWLSVLRSRMSDALQSMIAARRRNQTPCGSEAGGPEDFHRTSDASAA